MLNETFPVIFKHRDTAKYGNKEQVEEVGLLLNGQNTYHFFLQASSFFFHSPPRESRLKGASNAAHVRVVGPCRKARNKHILDHLLSLMLLLTTEIASNPASSTWFLQGISSSTW